jgi:glutamine synthetase
MLVQAGLEGIRRGRAIGAGKPQALPQTLEAALTLLESSESAAEWLGADLLAAYVMFKRAEIRGLANLEESEICRRYAEVY